MHTTCAGFSKTGASTGYPVSGTGYLTPGTWYPAPEPVRRRGPNTEHRRPSPATGKRAHRVCRMQDRTGCRVPGTWDPTAGTCFLVLTGKRVWKGCGEGMSIKTNGTGVKVQIG